MRSLATLGGLILLIVLAIAWKISNQVEAGQEVDSNTGVITLGVINEDGSLAKSTAEKSSAGSPQGTSPDGLVPPPSNSDSPASTPADSPNPNTPSSNAPEEGGHEGSSTPAKEPPIPPAPTPEEPETQPTAETHVLYVVAEGDTLYSILMRTYGKANEELIEAIAQANELDDPSALSIGMQLKLPAVEGYDAPQRPL